MVTNNLLRLKYSFSSIHVPPIKSVTIYMQGKKKKKRPFGGHFAYFMSDTDINNILLINCMVFIQLAGMQCRGTSWS